MRILIILFFLLPLFSWAEPETIRPNVKTPTSFAIVVDRQSYEHAKSSIEAYRDAIEQDGLATYILIDEWQSPEVIRDLLKELHTNHQMPLEGAVFIGDIPIPMIRAVSYTHLTLPTT